MANVTSTSTTATQTFDSGLVVVHAQMTTFSLTSSLLSVYECMDNGGVAHDSSRRLVIAEDAYRVEDKRIASIFEGVS